MPSTLECLCAMLAKTTNIRSLITTVSLTGQKRYYHLTVADTPADRQALLFKAVQEATSHDLIYLESGAFLIPAGGLTPQLQAGVTGVTIFTAPKATYSYVNNEDSVADYALFPWPQQVGSLAELQSAVSGAVASTKERTIQLTENIEITTPAFYIPRAKTIIPNGHMFIKSGSGTLYFRGTLSNGLSQVFSGFGIGEVAGPLFNDEIYPEWWGLVDNNHDIAINCALRTSGLVNGLPSCVVKLGPRTYDVSHEIDMGFSQATLLGCGGSKTAIVATSAWTDTKWMKCEQWGPVDTVPNHGAIIWIGNSDYLRQYSFRSKVIGIDINVTNASLSPGNWNNYYISGISARYGVEEGTQIHDVSVAYASGFAVGFARHVIPETGAMYGASVVNGVDLFQVWVFGSCHRDSVAINSGLWANNFTLRNSTIAPGLHKSMSIEYNVPGDSTPGYQGPGGNDPNVYPAPPQICDYPLAAIIASGNCTITDVHIEGPIIGVLVKEGNSDNVNISNVKAFGLMDLARNAVYFLDGKSGMRDNGSGEPNWVTVSPYEYGCIVFISGRAYPPFGEANLNRTTRCSVSNLTAVGPSCYLLRDPAFGIHRTILNMGQFPDPYTVGAGGLMTFYVRGNVYTGSGGGAIYDPSAPVTDRVYFIGPIY